jgi:hypothetical protein
MSCMARYVLSFGGVRRSMAERLIFVNECDTDGRCTSLMTR